MLVIKKINNFRAAGPAFHPVLFSRCSDFPCRPLLTLYLIWLVSVQWLCQEANCKLNNHGQVSKWQELNRKCRKSRCELSLSAENFSASMSWNRTNGIEIGFLPFQRPKGSLRLSVMGWPEYILNKCWIYQNVLAVCIWKYGPLEYSRAGTISSLVLLYFLHVHYYLRKCCTLLYPSRIWMSLFWFPVYSY